VRERERGLHDRGLAGELLTQPLKAGSTCKARRALAVPQEAEGSALVEDGGGDSGSCPMSEVGVISGAGGGGGGAMLLGCFFASVLTAFLAAAALAGAFFGAALFVFFATFLAGFRAARAFFFTVLRLAAVRFAFATGRFFPLPFFFAMVSLLLGSYGSSQ
jgi:hypothetical protein